MHLNLLFGLFSIINQRLKKNLDEEFWQKARSKSVKFLVNADEELTEVA